MTSGVILAGGKGSRLGPMAAQISKALVSIGQRPHLAHQIELLTRNGCDDIVVVTSPDTDRQIADVIERANLSARTIVQPTARGPVHALALGLETVNGNEDAIVIMADTYLDSDLVLESGDWYGTAYKPSERPFCYWDGESTYIDGTPPSDDSEVTVGVYRFTDVKDAYILAVRTVAFDGWGREEVGMAPFLTAYANVHFSQHIDLTKEWMDIGDVMALAKARRTKFISRETHHLALGHDGTITKRGSADGFKKQRDWMIEASADEPIAHLVPTVYRYDDTSYTMEYVDLPTLSELWLYWPGRSDTWQQILQAIIDQLTRAMWHPANVAHVAPLDGDVERKMFVEKAKARLKKALIPASWETILNPMLNEAASLFDGSQLVQAHGDLNWNNILFSLNTGSFKLVDPRGDRTLPITYELAKLGYSWTGFSAITHNLRLKNRSDERKALDEVLLQHIDRNKLVAAEACLFIAGAALHEPRQRDRMLRLGHHLLKGIL